MTSLRPVWALAAIALCAPACSIVVDDTLRGRGGTTDTGMVGETCTTDEQCVSFDAFNCRRVCVEGHCMGGAPLETPDGTACGNTGTEHCVDAVCVTRECGDGFVDRTATPIEYCDDGNENPDDGCNNVCTRSCVAPAPANCDDGNTCNGTETCMAGVGLCRGSAPLADDTECEISAGTSGVCSHGLCIAP
jgi:cysteine-rich repeat protein